MNGAKQAQRDRTKAATAGILRPLLILFLASASLLFPLAAGAQETGKSHPTDIWTELLPDELTDSIAALFTPQKSGGSPRRESRHTMSSAILQGEPVSIYVHIGPMESLADKLMEQGIQPGEVHLLAIEGKLDEADFALIRDYMHLLVFADLAHTDARTIPDYTFAQKKYLLSVRLPQNLQRIGQRAFHGCRRLCGTLLLPPEVTAIEQGAFTGCDRLHSVLITGHRLTALGDNLFGNSSAENKLQYAP